MPRMCITYNPKSIPSRSFDWEATLDNYEPGCPIGFGAIRSEAVFDLWSQLMDHEPSVDEICAAFTRGIK